MKKMNNSMTAKVKTIKENRMFQIVEGILAIIGIIFICLVLYSTMYTIPTQRRQIDSQISYINTQEEQAKQQLNETYQLYDTDAKAPQQIINLLGQFQGMENQVKGMEANPYLNQAEKINLNILDKNLGSDIQNCFTDFQQAQDYWSQL